MPTYAEIKSGAAQFVAPSTTPSIGSVNKYAAPAAGTDPELTRALQDVARRLGRERPMGITSADVIATVEVEDQVLYRRLEMRDRRLMGAVFPKTEWMKTGEWRTTGSHGRAQQVWVLKAARVAA